MKINKKWINILLKASILGVFSFVIYKQIVNGSNIESIYNQFVDSLQTTNIIYLMLTLLLMPLNWVCESEKWRRLLKPSFEISIFRSLRGILSGLVIGLMTPNRIGEYGGRIFVLPAEKNWDGIMATLAGSIAQNLANWIFGGVGAILFFNLFYVQTDVNPLMYYSLIPIVVILLLMLYFNIGLIENIIMRLVPKKWKEKVHKSISALKLFSSKLLRIALIISVFRYLIYLAQYFLLLRFFGVEVDMFSAFVGISTVFVLQSAIPLPSILSVLTRAEIALFVWGVFSFNEIAILASTYSLWFINLMLPSILGTVFIFRTNIMKTLGF